MTRRIELDIFRGVLLVMMTLTHLPTRLSAYASQPLGFVSAAEGFVFLSAFVASIAFSRLLQNQGPRQARRRAWSRAIRLYGLHLGLLFFAFTVAATVALRMGRPALSNLLSGYLVEPVWSAVGSLFLLYQPPLLDILPMYVTFLFFTPLLLSAAVRRGWRQIVLASALVWLAAQFGLREAAHNVVVDITHLHIPLQETGAFNLFAWQAVWIAGLFLGAKSAVGEVPLKRLPGWAFATAAVVCLFFIGVRHDLLGPHLTQEALGLKLDKWQIGWLRVVNLISFTMVFYWLRKYVIRAVSVEPFLTLGKASLQVFCAHLFFVFVGLALLYGEVEQLHGITAITLVAVTFAALIWVASNEVRKKRRARERKRQQSEEDKAPGVLPPSTQTMACAEQQS